MEAHLQEISNKQKQSWNTFSPGWKKWNNWVMQMLDPMGKKIIEHLDLKETDIVLDVATGTGEPGLTIAEKVKRGNVIGIDLSEGMLATAMEHAEERNLENYEAHVMDVTEMPFEDNYFDKVSCRMGFMFFPDMQLAANEIVRVMKPGAKFATCVWARPENNFWVTSIMGPVMKNMHMEPPPPDAPGMFRCADPQMMTRILSRARLRNIEFEYLQGQGEVESLSQYWDYMNDVAAPMVEAMKNADDTTKKKIKDEAMGLLKQRYPAEGTAYLENEALMIYGEK